MTLDGVIAAIFARAGSKGLPGKNLLQLDGEPLVARAVRIAREAGLRVYISTDSLEIREAAVAAGAEGPFLRPSSLAQDTTPERLAWRHLVQWIHHREGPEACRVLVSVPAVAPLRDIEDVQATLSALLADPSADMALTITDTQCHPGFTMVYENQGKLRLVAPPTGAVHRRQDVPPVWQIVPVCYAARVPHILEDDSLWDGHVVGVRIPRARSVDIDTADDWDLVRWRHERNKGSRGLNEL